MSSMIGISARPFSVSAYSTRGGTSGKVWRSTTPSSSSARRRSESVRGLMPASDRSSSQNRERRSARSRMINSVHFPHTMSAVAHTGHVSFVAITCGCYRKTLRTEVRRGRGGSAAEQAAQPAAAPARGGHAALGGLHEDPALPGEGDLEALSRALADQVLDVDVRLDRRRHAGG